MYEFIAFTFLAFCALSVTAILSLARDHHEHHVRRVVAKHIAKARDAERETS